MGTVGEELVWHVRVDGEARDGRVKRLPAAAMGLNCG